LGQPLFENQDKKVELEARNGLLLFDEILKIFSESRNTFRINPGVIKRLHSVTVGGIYSCAGTYRTRGVTIKGSSHRPPRHEHVAGLVEAMCEVATDNKEWEPTQTAAFLLWRLNWIHPFAGGNGRTSRAFAYLALMMRLGFPLPGKLTILEQIVNNRGRYQEALEDADEAWRTSVLDTSKMQLLLAEFLERQLAYLDEDDTDSRSSVT